MLYKTCVSELIISQGMGYGSKALSLLHDYYNGNMTSLNEEATTNMTATDNEVYYIST